MSTKGKFLLAIISVFIVLGALIVIGHKTPGRPTEGSAVLGNDYIATSSASIWAGIPHVIATSTNIQSLGSVIVTTTDASVVQIMDATSSTDVSSTTIAQFQASPALNTYTFDVRILRGLIINTVGGFAGRYTITYR